MLNLRIYSNIVCFGNGVLKERNSLKLKTNERRILRMENFYRQKWWSQYMTGSYMIDLLVVIVDINKYIDIKG